MKLIIQKNRIAATATTEYQTNGMEQAVLDAPAGFDLVRMGEYQYGDGVLALPVPNPIIANETAIQDALDAKARERGYSDIKSACAYSSTVAAVSIDDINFIQCERFRVEGNALQAWMSITWASAYTYLETVKAGTNPMPTLEQAVALMPTFTWPD